MSKKENYAKQEAMLIQQTDFIKEDNATFNFGFPWSTLDLDSDYTDSLFKCLLHAMKEIKYHKNKVIRERAFTIWAGDHNQIFWIAVPENMSSKVTGIIDKYFKEEFPKITHGFGRTDKMALIPVFRYSFGHFIQYIEEDAAGGFRVDDADWYGTNETIYFKARCPTWLNGGKEFYTNVDPNTSFNSQ